MLKKNVFAGTFLPSSLVLSLKFRSSLLKISLMNNTTNEQEMTTDGRSREHTVQVNPKHVVTLLIN